MGGASVTAPLFTAAKAPLYINGAPAFGLASLVAPPDDLLPAGSVTWGVCLGYTPDPEGAHEDFANLVGHTPKLVLTFPKLNQAWLGSSTAPLPGQVPVITWEPWEEGDMSATPGILDAIIAGDFDAEITAQATLLGAYGDAVIMRPMHEMNGNWYPWSGASNGGNLAAAAKYRAAWIHFHGLVTAQANNVKWLWCTNSSSLPAESWNDSQNFYPGAAYVDYIGTDGYDWGNPSTSFSDVFFSWYYAFRSYGKPLLLGETAAADNGTSSTSVVTTGQNKAAWITDMASVLQTSMPFIRGLIWFSLDKERLWQVDSSGPALAAFQAASANWLSAPPLSGDELFPMDALYPSEALYPAGT